MVQCKFVRIDERRGIHARCRRDAKNDGYCAHHAGGPQNTLAVNAASEITRLKNWALMCHLRKNGTLDGLIEEALSSPKSSFFTDQIKDLEAVVRSEVAEPAVAAPLKPVYISVVQLGLSEEAQRALLMKGVFSLDDLRQRAESLILMPDIGQAQVDEIKACLALHPEDCEEVQ